MEDVKINNIVAESTKGEKILVTWKLGNSVQNNAIFDKPVTSIVRYKVIHLFIFTTLFIIYTLIISYDNILSYFSWFIIHLN